MDRTTFFLKFIIVLITKTKRPASPSGLVLFYCLYPLYPAGLSGLTLNFLNVNQAIGSFCIADARRGVVRRVD
jgi:hypothetical protein